MKIGIIQTDNRLDNSVFNEMFALNKKYAEIHNYTYIFNQIKLNQKLYEWQDLIYHEENLNKLKAYITRYQLFEKYINDFDYLVYMDSDAVINNPNIKIEDLIDDTHDLFVGPDCGIFTITVHLVQSAVTVINYLRKNNLSYLKDPDKELEQLKIFDIPIKTALKNISTNTMGLNSGFMIIKCSDIIKKFLEDYKKYYPVFQEYFFDQGCLAKMLRTKKYSNILKLLPLTTQGNPYYQHPDFIYNEDKNFICHYYGVNSDLSRLMNHFQSIKNNKWWKNIKEKQ